MNLALAWRNVWRNKMRSLIIIASVAIGLFAGLFVLGLYEGMLRTRVRTVIYTEVAHLQMHHPKFKDDYDPAFTMENLTMIDELKNIPAIRHVTTRSVTQGMLATTSGSAGVQVNGVMADENAVSQLDSKIWMGKGLSPQMKNGILVGKKLADKLNLEPGNKLVLMFTDKESNMTSGAFRVAGIYQTDNTPLDELNVYVNKATLNDYLTIGEAFHEVAIILQRDEDMETVKALLQQKFPACKVQTWKENSPETNLMVGTVNQYSVIIILIIMLALAFGIINTMFMSVLERTREIGMLSALGMNRLRVFTLILTETMLLTIVGAPVGLFFGWFSIHYYAKVGIDISSFSGEAMSGFGFSSMIYPEFPNNQMLTTISIVIGTALVSSLFPSLRAIRFQPADALRQ